MIAGSIVWVQGLRGPAPEKWPADAPKGTTEGKIVLARHNLSVDEFALALTILEQRYPPPPQKEEP